MSVLAHPKILSLQALRRKLAPLRAAGKTIVFTNGCFDILHPGHVDLLARAKAHGDILIVGLNADLSVKRLGKGDDRPFTPCAARAFVLAHLESVDFVIAFDEDTPLRLIQAIRPHVLVKGGDWTPENIVGSDVVAKNGGRTLSLPLLGNWSTTKLAMKIREIG